MLLLYHKIILVLLPACAVLAALEIVAAEAGGGRQAEMLGRGALGRPSLRYATAGQRAIKTLCAGWPVCDGSRQPTGQRRRDWSHRVADGFIQS